VHRPWDLKDWTSSDDRVRGGASTSFLDAHSNNPIATFVGHLDITALGGAGFASQRTTNDTAWDLSNYDGLELDIEKSDGKRYVVTIKDEIMPKRGDGREQSTVSWEFDFKIADGQGERVFIPWSALKPTYRGREKKDAEPLKIKDVQRISFMMRSFFGEQQGNFQLGIRSVAAVQKKEEAKISLETVGSLEEEKEVDRKPLKKQQGWSAWVLGCCTRL
jgi:hypothetical protein